MSYKEIKINEELYEHIFKHAEKENLSIEDFLSKIIYYTHKDYSQFADIKIKDTGVINCIGNQSSVYSRLLANNIQTLKELFEMNDARIIDLGNDSLKENQYIHAEVNGIIRLLQYKYLGLTSDELNTLLNYEINTYPIKLQPHEYKKGQPGNIFKKIYYQFYDSSMFFSETMVGELYKVLKYCGFNQTSVKALIDIAFQKGIKNTTLGEFLMTIDSDDIRETFHMRPQEAIYFINIKTILIDYYKKHIQTLNTDYSYKRN